MNSPITSGETSLVESLLRSQHFADMTLGMIEAAFLIGHPDGMPVAWTG